MAAETLFQPKLLSVKKLADLHPEALDNLLDIATDVVSSKRSSVVGSMVVYPKIPGTPSEVHVSPEVLKDNGESVHLDSSHRCITACPVAKESHTIESVACNVLNQVLKCFEGTKGFVFWNSCFHSVFKLTQAPRQDPDVFMEVLVLTDTKVPILFIFTNSVRGSRGSSAPDLTSYRISLAQALTSKIQSFIPDTICIMSSTVLWKKGKPLGGSKETQDDQHSQGSVQLDDFMKTAEEEAEKYMSPKALVMTAGKFKGLVQATLAALAVTTVYSKENDSDSSGRRQGLRTFLRRHQFERICEPFLHRMAVRMPGKTVLAVEFALRRSLEQKTLFVSNELHVLEIIENIMKQRRSDSDLKATSYDSCFGADSGAGPDARSNDGWVPDVVVADDFDDNCTSSTKTSKRPLLKRLPKTFTILLCINSMGTNDVNRAIRFQIPMYSGSLKPKTRGNSSAPQGGSLPLPPEKSATSASAGSPVPSQQLPKNILSLQLRCVDDGDQKCDEGKTNAKAEKEESARKLPLPSAHTPALQKCSEEAKRDNSWLSALPQIIC